MHPLRASGRAPNREVGCRQTLHALAAHDHNTGARLLRCASPNGVYGMRALGIQDIWCSVEQRGRGHLDLRPR